MGEGINVYVLQHCHKQELYFLMQRVKVGDCSLVKEKRVPT